MTIVEIAVIGIITNIVLSLVSSVMIVALLVRANGLLQYGKDTEVLKLHVESKSTSQLLRGLSVHLVPFSSIVIFVYYIRSVIAVNWDSAKYFEYVIALDKKISGISDAKS